MQTSLIITSKGTGANAKSRKRSVTDINPNATNDEMKAFAVALVGLSKSNYEESTRVDKASLDTAGSYQNERNLKVTNLASDSTATITFRISENETTRPAVFYYANNAIQTLSVTAGEGTSTQAVYTTNIPTVPQDSAVVYIGVPSSTNFKSEFLRIAISQ